MSQTQALLSCIEISKELSASFAISSRPKSRILVVTPTLGARADCSAPAVSARLSRQPGGELRESTILQSRAVGSVGLSRLPGMVRANLAWVINIRESPARGSCAARGIRGMSVVEFSHVRDRQADAAPASRHACLQRVDVGGLRLPGLPRELKHCGPQILSPRCEQNRIQSYFHVASASIT